jgi:hypothetical protein
MTEQNDGEELTARVEYDANGVPRLSQAQTDEFVRLVLAPSPFTLRDADPTRAEVLEHGDWDGAA